MKTYRVKWEIDVEAESHEAAARKAIEMQSNPETAATVFDVAEHAKYGLLCHAMRVDLLKN